MTDTQEARDRLLIWVARQLLDNPDVIRRGQAVNGIRLLARLREALDGQNGKP